MNKNEPPHHVPQQSMHTSHPPPMRRYDDVAPPGTDQPPIPGEEPSPRYEDTRYSYERTEPRTMEQDREVERNYERRSRSPSRSARNPSPKPVATRNKERYESPERHKRKKHEDSSDKKEVERDKYKKETSDDEKVKKSRDKKKKKEKKEAEKKKRKDRKDKREEKHKRRSEERDKKIKIREEIADVKVDDVKVEINEPEEKTIADFMIEPDELPPNLDPIQEENSREDDHERFRNKDPPEPPQTLYDDMMSENVDDNIVKTYGKLDAELEKTTSDDFEQDQSKEYEDVLDIHTNESELIKAESDLKPEVLAPLPEKSKWELEEEPLNMPIENKYDLKNDKPGKVTNEVLKRAENAIFAKAINAIRPIEIKKISVDRAKLYSGERDKKEEEIRNLQVTIKGQEETLQSAVIDPVKIETTSEQPSKRIPVKERLGCKVDDLDRIVKVDRRSRSKSASRRNYERRVELDDRRDKRDRERYERDRYHRTGYRNENRRERDINRRLERDVKDRRDTRRDDRRDYRRDDRYKREEKKDVRQEEDKAEKRKRSKSNSEERKHKKRDKKVKKEKVKKPHDESAEKETEPFDKDDKPKITTEKRKTTLDEANFEPDYDLYSESEKDDKDNKRISPITFDIKKPKLEEKRKESSSSESSSSSSEDEKKKKKHKKHKKKKSRKDSSSSSSESESDSSEEEQRKRKKHKKKSKKRKKSKHK